MHAKLSAKKRKSEGILDSLNVGKKCNIHGESNVCRYVMFREIFLKGNFLIRRCCVGEVL